jgi:2-methylcitrate dehydratase PrpD
MSDAVAVTETLAEFALHGSGFSDQANEAGVRSFVNILGCAFGGARHRATDLAYAVNEEFFGQATTTLIGRGRLADALSGAYLNCLAMSAHAFDDTHLSTVLHPAGPIAGALFALAERQSVTGKAFLDAFIVGIEVQCRLGVALMVPPARSHVGWYATGIAGGIGAAAASARVLGLTVEQTRWALGLAANQASGFRQTHGSMCTSFTPAHAARSGLHSALLASGGFTSSNAALEGGNGYFDVFSEHANPAAAVLGLGQDWHIMDNAFKPYPCGIVIHPVLDACLEIAREDGFNAEHVDSITLSVDPLCLTLCDRPAPQDSQLAQVSVQHWAAAALVHGAAGLAQGSDDCVHDPAVVGVRNRVNTEANSNVGRDGAIVTVRLGDGTCIERTVEHCIGSAARPMSNAELEAKFIGQAADVLGGTRAQALVERAWALKTSADVGELIGTCAP